MRTATEARCLIIVDDGLDQLGSFAEKVGGDAVPLKVVDVGLAKQLQPRPQQDLLKHRGHTSPVADEGERAQHADRRERGGRGG